MKELDWASKAYEKIIETGHDWADKDAAAKFFEDSRHTVLCEEKLKVTTEKSDAAKETVARASKVFKDYMIDTRAARKAANLARVNWEAAKTLASLRQTQESLRKAEMKLV